MRSKSVIRAFLAICITAILGIAVCGCDDLGEYEDTEEYYDCFGDIVLIGGTSKETDEYSIADYFYNEESREDFLQGEDGSYKGVKHSDYVYMAIPFESNIVMDTLALYMESESDVNVYISVYVTDKIPSEWKSLTGDDESSDEEKEYDDPDPETRVGDVTIQLKSGKWDSFVLEMFTVNGTVQNSIQINEGEYVLLQMRNNSGIRIFDEQQQTFVDPQTGLELEKAEVTMTNLLIRALEIHNDEEQGGEE